MRNFAFNVFKATTYEHQKIVISTDKKGKVWIDSEKEDY